MTVEGTAIHEVAAKVLQDFIEHGRKGHTYKRSDFLDTVASNGTVISSEMLDVAETYIRDIIEVSGRFDGLAKVMIEYRVRMPRIHKENWGTLDAAIVFTDLQARTMVVGDLKCGWGIVEVWENWQLIDYAVGLIEDTIERGIPLPETIEFRLIQPRPYHRDGPVRVWKITLAELEPYVQRLRDAAHDALGPNPTFRTGEHCAHCEGRSDCPALIQSGYSIIKVLKGVQPQELKGAALGMHIAMLREAQSLVKALGEALEDKGLLDVQQGRAIPGWTWDRTKGRTKFTVPDAEVFALGDLCGVELRSVKAITPLQAITAGMPKDVISTVTAQDPGSAKLVPVDTKRIAEIFNQESK